MNIYNIAEKLNEKSSDYNIGNLQEIRKKINNFKRRPGSKIFSNQTISDDWACHYGGRKEIQFNIGLEDNKFRYGLAFSLETTQTLPDPKILYPKIRKLNNIFRENPGIFSDYKYWYWIGDKRSKTMNMQEIPAQILKPGSFIFFGKLVEKNEIDEEKILTVFDEMLPIYFAVESDDEFSIFTNNKTKYEFNFSRKKTNLVFNRQYSFVEKQINIDIRHSEIQVKLKKKLEMKYGVENVSLENSYYGNRIDAVVKDGEDYFFYEIKVASTIKACIRQAIGQLFEYAFWPGKRNASKIVIVGEYPINEKAKRYIKFLKKEFKIPIEYLHIDIDN